ncbi:hypothetical protein [Lentibacillus amyloliquefaciens]|uniref:Uncharacterized protein n=1 Tax=Lentibacillus amyloliquefaciens TaxID=1472767 RepID=A0A0U4FRV9_9BACI|nr:hypothetical protein [Lentibacillus amyloliquefaciens]ALX50452.1 hypothetical protein AOX59_18820 [Lentibacillus amyloliquefaciens]
MQINEKEVTLSEDEAMLFGSILFGTIKGYDQKRDEGHYFSKEEREVSEMIKYMLEQLEDNDII